MSRAWYSTRFGEDDDDDAETGQLKAEEALSPDISVTVYHCSRNVITLIAVRRHARTCTDDVTRCSCLTRLVIV